MASRHKLIKWYKDQQGMISYSRTDRLGPQSYDGASAMFAALIYAGFLSDTTYLGEISVLSHLEGSLLQPISMKDIRRGDIFISRVNDGVEINSEGHTGVLIDHRRIIYCSEEYDGIIVSSIRQWNNETVKWYRLAEPIRKNKSLLECLQDCMMEYNRRKAIQAIKNLKETKKCYN